MEPAVKIDQRTDNCDRINSVKYKCSPPLMGITESNKL